MEKFDFGKEQEDIASKPKGGNGFYQPKAGKHRIRIVSQPKYLGEKAFKEGEKPKARMGVEVEEDGKTYLWTMNRTSDERGTWTKFVKLGSHLQKEGKDIVGSFITLLVTGEGQKKTYEILELYDIGAKAGASSPPSPSDNRVEAFL